MDVYRTELSHLLAKHCSKEFLKNQGLCEKALVSLLRHGPCTVIG